MDKLIKLIDFFIQDSYFKNKGAHDKENLLKNRLIVGFSLAAFLIAFPSLFFYLYKYGTGNIFWIIFVSTLVYLSIPILNKLLRCYNFLGSILLISGMLPVAFSIIFQGPHIHLSLIWLSPLIITSNLIFPKKGNILWPIVFTILGGISYYINKHFDVEVIPQPDVDLITFLSMTGVTIAILLELKIYNIEKDRLQEEVTELYNGHKKLLNIVCHDLSNPITLSLNSIDRILSGKCKDEKLEKCYQNISNATHMSKAIIDKIRELQAIDFGKLHSKIVPVNLHSSIEQAISLVNPRLKNKNISIDFDSNKFHGIIVEADEVLLTTSVFANILSNAIKFSFKDSKIIIDISQNEKQVVIKFLDDGVGIAKENLKNIFSLYEKTTNEGTEGERGTGFGMPLIKSTLESFKGEILVSSFLKEEHKNRPYGTCVEIRLNKSK